MLRIGTAVVLAPALWLLIKLGTPELFFYIGLAVLALALWECYRMLEQGGARPFMGLGIAAGLAVAWSFVEIGPRFGLDLPFAALGVSTVALAMWRRDAPRAMLDTAISTVFPVLFVGLGLSYIIGLRAMPGEDGKDLLLLLFGCVILADTGAFYVGTLFGRTRMAPVLSGKKSWEGGGGLAHVWFYQRLPLGHAIALGLIIGVTSIVGDLSESMVKRAVGVKDSSSILPGHGGILDRTDSLLISGPVLYYYYRLFLEGPP
jgi:phosphatidate cytidylyltransferase